MEKLNSFLTLLFFFPIIYGDVRSNRVRRIVGGNPSDVALSEEPIVFLHYAGRSARIRGIFQSSQYNFRGIRYAFSPTGRDRFQRPRKYFLDGEYDATSYPPPCTQSIPGDDFIVGSEDCLFLNVFTPNLPDGTEGLPVVVWIHGGGFRYGSASQYGTRHLVKKRLILVTIQYRLGSFGFLSSGNPTFPGNAALFDMALAVEWVRNHIGFFGGNPYKVTIMGQGTGASSALLLALSDIAKGTASGVIAMSGTAVSHWAIDNTPADNAKDVANYHGCPTTSILTMVKCLQNIPPASIVRGDSYIESTRLQKRGFISGLSGLLSSSPVIEGSNDGRSLPFAVQRKPLDDMYTGNIPKIPLLTGITRDETKKAIHGQYKNEVVSNLKSVPHFLDNVLIKELQSFTGLEEKSQNSQKSTFCSLADPFQFRTYLKVTKNNIEEGLTKISEVTGDALFNLPAFLTADLWSKAGAPTYLYRFEHCGQARRGNAFLKGVPIVGNHSANHLNDTVCHGDDLAYLFEVHDLDGSSMKDYEIYNAEDDEVRDIYTQIVADFARHGKVIIKNDVIPSFTSTSNNFIQIRSKPKLGNNFRFCEMALWSGLTERLQSTSCQFLNVLNTNVRVLNDTFFDIIKQPNLNEISKPTGKQIIPLGTGKFQQTVDDSLSFKIFG